MQHVVNVVSKPVAAAVSPSIAVAQATAKVASIKPIAKPIRTFARGASASFVEPVRAGSDIVSGRNVADSVSSAGVRLAAGSLATNPSAELNRTLLQDERIRPTAAVATFGLSERGLNATDFVLRTTETGDFEKREALGAARDAAIVGAVGLAGGAAVQAIGGVSQTMTLANLVERVISGKASVNDVLAFAGFDVPAEYGELGDSLIDAGRAGIGGSGSETPSGDDSVFDEPVAPAARAGWSLDQKVMVAAGAVLAVALITGGRK